MLLAFLDVCTHVTEMHARFMEVLRGLGSFDLMQQELATAGLWPKTAARPDHHNRAKNDIDWMSLRFSMIRLSTKRESISCPQPLAKRVARRFPIACHVRYGTSQRVSLRRHVKPLLLILHAIL